MPISHRAESDSPSEYSDEVWQVTRLVDSDLSLRNQQQIPLGRETSPQNAMFYNDEVWRDAAVSSSSSDTSSPQDEQQNMTVWGASSRKAREYTLDRELEQDPILFAYENSPFDFITTSLSREHRRRRQNRDAQRAFRARERIRVQSLEDRLEDVTKQYTKLKSAYLHLNAKYQSILEQAEIKEEVVNGSMALWEESSASDFASPSSLLCVPEASLGS